jgi:hypothetical protein
LKLLLEMQFGTILLEVPLKNTGMLASHSLLSIECLNEEKLAPAHATSLLSCHPASWHSCFMALHY